MNLQEGITRKKKRKNQYIVIHDAKRMFILGIHQWAQCNNKKDKANHYKDQKQSRICKPGLNLAKIFHVNFNN